MSLCATCRARARGQIDRHSWISIQAFQTLRNTQTVQTRTFQSIAQTHLHYIRHLTTSRLTRDQARPPQQQSPQSQPNTSPPTPAQPRPKTFPTRDLGAFYNEIIPTSSSSSSSSTPNLPEWVPTRTDLAARAAQLFSSIDGSGYISSNDGSDSSSWQTINGVRVPPRPREPENCCMSGCVNCVWDDYRIDVEAWAGRVREARSRARGAGEVSVSASPSSGSASSSMDDDGGGSEALWTEASTVSEAEGDELFSDIPVGIREFMASEKRIRERKRAKRKERVAD